MEAEQVFAAWDRVFSLSCLFTLSWSSDGCISTQCDHQPAADIPGASHPCVQTGANAGSLPVLQSSNSPQQVRNKTELSAELRTTAFQGTTCYCLWNSKISPITPQQWVAPLAIPSVNLWETAVHHKYPPSGDLYISAGGTSSKWGGVVAGVCKLVASVLFLSYSSWSVALFKLFSFCISIFTFGKAHPPLGRCCPRLPSTAKQRRCLLTGCVNTSPQVIQIWPAQGETMTTVWHLPLSLTGAFTWGPPSVQELCMPQVAVMATAAQQGDTCSATVTLQIEITAGWGQKYLNKVCNKVNSSTWNGKKKNTSINLTPPSLMTLLAWKWTTPTKNLVSPQQSLSALFITHLAWS